MERCVPEMIDSGHPQDQAVAICLDMWRNKGERAVKFKASDIKTGPVDFVLRDETPDRMGDVIRADGWELSNFRQNPIALFAHNSSFPIGTWKSLRVEAVDKQPALVGTLQLAPAGTSDRIDEIRRLVDAGILKGTSVGFRELQSQPRRDKEGHMVGLEFTRQELVEASLVAVPANPAALAIAKQLGVSEATRSLVFRQRQAPPADDLVRELCGEVERLCKRVEQMQIPVTPTERAAAASIVNFIDSRKDLHPGHDGWRWAHEVLKRELTRLR